MNYIIKEGEYVISTVKEKIDIEYVHGFLSQTYWATGIPLDTVKKAVKGSLNFGVYHNDKQIGFARMITDSATFAYLADVFIDQKYRGKGLSKWLIKVILAHPGLQGLRRIMLGTKDAHGLYKKFGFIPLANIESWMQIHNPDVYKKTL